MVNSTAMQHYSFATIGYSCKRKFPVFRSYLCFLEVEFNGIIILEHKICQIHEFGQYSSKFIENTKIFFFFANRENNSLYNCHSWLQRSSLELKLNDFQKTSCFRKLAIKSCFYLSCYKVKLDGVGPVDNRPSTD